MFGLTDSERLTKDEQAAKEFVNRLRKLTGHRALGKLKKGIPLHPLMCPVVRSLEDCGVVSASYNRGRGVVHLSPDRRAIKSRTYYEPAVADFMNGFDMGDYPDLEIPKATTMKIKKPNERKLTEVPL